MMQQILIFNFLYALPQLNKFESDSDADNNLENGSPSAPSKKPLTDAHDKSPEDVQKGGANLQPGQQSREASQPTEKLIDKVQVITSSKIKL